MKKGRKIRPYMLWLCMRQRLNKLFDDGFSGVNCGFAQFFLDAHKLVIFIDTFAAGYRASLDLAGDHRNGEVGNKGVSSFTAAMAHHAGPASFVGGVDGVQGFCDAAKLVKLVDHTVRGLLL